MVMVIEVVKCPHCGEGERVRRHGANRNGTRRCYCVVCHRAFTLLGRPRRVSAEREADIARALLEKTPIIGIARALKVSPNTVRRVLKKT